jgi:hypothetical protein
MEYLDNHQPREDNSKDLMALLFYIISQRKDLLLHINRPNNCSNLSNKMPRISAIITTIIILFKDLLSQDQHQIKTRVLILICMEINILTLVKLVIVEYITINKQ